MQSRGGRVRSGLMAIRQPTQICRPCAVRHSANSVTRNVRLRSWMEGGRITCPCGCGRKETDGLSDDAVERTAREISVRVLFGTPRHHSRPFSGTGIANSLGVLLRIGHKPLR